MQRTRILSLSVQTIHSHWVHCPQISNIFFTAHNGRLRQSKVMFSVVSVCSGGGGVHCFMGPHSDTHHPAPCQGSTSQIKSGRTGLNQSHCPVGQRNAGSMPSTERLSCLLVQTETNSDVQSPCFIFTLETFTRTFQLLNFRQRL